MPGGCELKYLARNNDLNSVRCEVGGERWDMKCNKQLTTHRALHPNKTAYCDDKNQTKTGLNRSYSYISRGGTA